VRRTIEPALGNVPIGKVTAQVLEEFYAELRQLAAAVRWEWIRSNPADIARKPKQRRPQPSPPSPDEAARIVAAALAQDDDWGALVWLVMVTGLRRGEVLALRWSDVDLSTGMLTVRRSYVRAASGSIEKDTKTHQMRRISLDRDTVAMLAGHHGRYEEQAQAVGVQPSNQGYVFSYQPLHDAPADPSAVTHRYGRMCAQLGIDSHLHALRHYSATELLTAGVDLRTVAGRLGHGGGGATTLRVYAAWVGEADRKASEILGSRMRRSGPTDAADTR
jgi:integrase